MNTRWTLSVILSLLLVATTAFAAAVENPRDVSAEQDSALLVSQDDLGADIVNQFGDPDDLITGNRRTGITGSILDLGSVSTSMSDIEDPCLFLTLSQVLFLVR